MNYAGIAPVESPAPTGTHPSDLVPYPASAVPDRRPGARLPGILDAFPQAILLVNGNATIVGANTAAVDSLQAPGTHLVGLGVLDVLPQFDLSRTPGGLDCDDQADAVVRMTVRCTDSFEFTAEVAVRPVRHADVGHEAAFPVSGFDLHGVVHDDRGLLLVTISDLTARLCLEAELRRLHSQTTTILRATAEGVVGVDARGRIVLANPAATRFLGYGAADLGGRAFLSLAMPAHADGAPLDPDMALLTSTLRTGRGHRTADAVLWHRDGTARPVELSTAAVTDGDRIVGAIVAFADRSAVHAMTEQRNKTAALLERELRTPLGRVAHTLIRLADDPAGALWPEATQTLRRLAEDCLHAVRLTDTLLTDTLQTDTLPNDPDAVSPAAVHAPVTRLRSDPPAIPTSRRAGRHAGSHDENLRGGITPLRRPAPPTRLTVPGAVVDTGPPRRLPSPIRIAVPALESGPDTPRTRAAG
ncbi:PAS domain-containing protein [Uniformispora flossi]|uniref:PAS domain-containing protein n=1 Tax=Uniformispora flossi TaxID=3390723 RepID=UPI003C2B0F7B